MRLDRSTRPGYQYSGGLGLFPGIYPYLGTKTGPDLLAAARSYGGVAVPGRMGARYAAVR